MTPESKLLFILEECYKVVHNPELKDFIIGSTMYFHKGDMHF